MGEIKISQCRSCAANIIWVISEKGKRTPLDVDPTNEGIRFKLFAHPDLEGEALMVHTKVGPGFSSHFVTCPDRDEHRKT